MSFNPQMAMQFASALAPLMGGGGQQNLMAPPFQVTGAPQGLLTRSFGALDNSGNVVLPDASQPEEPSPIDKALMSVKDTSKGVNPKTSPKVEEGGFFNSFFETLDGNLQSPAKLGVLGLLNREDPRLGAAALVAMGLLGGKK